MEFYMQNQCRYMELLLRLLLLGDLLFLDAIWKVLAKFGVLSIGYPGDYNYREFYRDIGYDLDYEYIKPYIAHNGVRVNTGIKYYRITGKDCEKDYYDVQWAKDSVERQAGHFFDCRNAQIENLSSYMKVPPIITCPYDAELYGHWWYEGPYWLYILFKKIYYNDCNFELITQ